MKMSWLSMVQDILSDMDSDPVDTIDETVEAVQVSQILRTTFFNIIDGRDWPHLYNLFTLTATNALTPTHMTIPEDVTEIQSIRYNKRKLLDTRDKIGEIEYLVPDQFLDISLARNSSATDVTSVTDPSGIVLYIKNNIAPTYYTSFTDRTIVMDSFDSDIDTFLTSAKCIGYGKKYPTAVIGDGSGYPDMPVEAFSYLLAEAKATAFLTLKQQPNPKAEQHSVIQSRRMAREAWTTPRKDKYPSFGRRVKR